MLVVHKVILARDSANKWAPVPGLSPTWVHLTDADTRDQVDDKPEFHELPGGQYLVSLRVQPGQLLFGQVDLGPSLVSGYDRFADVYFEHPDCRGDRGFEG